MLLSLYTIVYGVLWFKASYSTYPLTEGIWMNRLTFPSCRVVGPVIRKMELGLQGAALTLYVAGLTQWAIVVAIVNSVAKSRRTEP